MGWPEAWAVVFELPVWVLAGAVLVALAVDHFWGEPPARWHPVVWMGNALSALGRRIAPPALAGQGPSAGGTQQTKAFWLGALAWCGLAAVVVLAAWWLQWWCLVWAPAWAAPLLLGLLLKPLFSLRMLCDEVRAVEAALCQSLAAGRERLSWLVSRDVAQLTAGEVRESAIETLAENLNDSVVAPLFWFAVAGLPGAALYRLANTADAMWGYQGERHGRDWTWAGKWAARADDVLSWLPARLTAALVLLVTHQPWRHWLALPREARRTPSPNSGWPMAAMALALGVRLGKPGVYALNAAGKVPQNFEVFKAIKYANKVALALVFIAFFALIYCAPSMGAFLRVKVPS